jgi:tetratricopeptide (TPR) repeat protein
MKHLKNSGRRHWSESSPLGKHIRFGRAGRTKLVLVGVLVFIAVVGFLALVLLPGMLKDPQSPEVSAPPLTGTPAADVPADPDTTPMTAETLRNEALDVCQQAMKDFPDSIDPLLLMGNFYHQLGNRSEAVKWWRKVLNRDPKHAGAHLQMAIVAGENGDHEKVVEFCRKARQIEPRLSRVGHQLARALLELGKSQEAVETLQEELRRNPKVFSSHSLLGQAYLQLKQYDQAVMNYEKALAAAPNDSSACYGLTLAYAKLGQADKAEQYQEKFRKIRKGKGELARDRRQERNDLNWMRRVVAVVHINTGSLVYLRQQRFNEAERHFKRAAVLDLNNQVCRQKLAGLYMQQKRFAEAEGICLQLCKLDPNNPTYYFNTGRILGKLQRFAAADKALGRAAALAPGSSPIRRMREQLRAQASRVQSRANR